MQLATLSLLVLLNQVFFFVAEGTGIHRLQLFPFALSAIGLQFHLFSDCRVEGMLEFWTLLDTLVQTSVRMFSRLV